MSRPPAWLPEEPGSTGAETPTPWEKLPPAPLTLEGAALLHHVMRLRRPAWQALSEAERTAIAAEAAEWLAARESAGAGRQSALYSLLGHKGDLLWLHFRPDFEELHRTERELGGLRLWRWLAPAGSLVSVVELGLYESTVKLWRALAARGVAPESAQWNAEVEALLERQRRAMQPRLYPEIPPARYLCFYPMARRRGEHRNFYRTAMPERLRMMREHGLSGRRYAEQVRQIISAATGLDDWEWGVDLFADDPVFFKKLVYEMRFDEASADYALFGRFYLGRRCPADELAGLLAGRPPALQDGRPSV